MSNSIRGKSKPTDDYVNVPEPELLRRMKLMPEPYRSYAAFTYLFGNRISEGGPGVSKFKDHKTGLVKERHFFGITKGMIHLNDDGYFEVDNLPTLKRKVKDATHFYRVGLVPAHGPAEAEFIGLVLDRMAQVQDNEPMWNKSRKTYWHYFNKYLGIPPKKLRGMRAQKDAKTYGMTAIELKELFNWGSVDMPFHYAKYNKQDIKNKINRAIQQQK